MVSMNQIEAGVTRWLDKELMPKLPTGGQYDGIKKAATISGSCRFHNLKLSVILYLLLDIQIQIMGLSNNWFWKGVYVWLVLLIKNSSHFTLLTICCRTPMRIIQ
jgi:hypothetical protein